MRIRFYFLLAALIVSGIATTDLSAQARRSDPAAPSIEELPRIAIDTLHTNDADTRIILYSNNTWSYFRPDLSSKYDDLQVFNQHWDTTQIFAYRSVQLTELPSVVDLRLFNSLSDFSAPYVGKVYSKYGKRGRRNHNGVDLPLKVGEPVYATFDGKIRYSKYNTGGYGNLIIVRHENGLETWYAHLSKRNVTANEYVKAGEIIGYGGNTGRSRGAHLHFEMRYCDQTFDPEFLIDFESGQIRYQTFALEKSFFNIDSRASEQLEDHGDDYLAMAFGADGDELTSEDIVRRLTEPQETIPATASASVAQSQNQSNTVYHTIKSGDMLGKLAIKYGVSIDQICRLNNITRTTTLRIGRKLRIK